MWCADTIREQNKAMTNAPDDACVFDRVRQKIVGSLCLYDRDHLCPGVHLGGQQYKYDCKQLCQGHSAKAAAGGWMAGKGLSKYRCYGSG